MNTDRPASTNERPRPELLAPAGDWDCLRAAVANGADGVYFGLSSFNARMRAQNFDAATLPAVVEYLHARGVRAHVALNTLIFTAELGEAAALLERLEAAAVDVVIVQDLGLAALAREVAPGVEVCASTQMTVTSPEGARLVARLGVRQVVLARELSLREIAHFQADDLPATEVFVHGALCVAYSGQCLTSESLGHRSANRGECAQACREPYELIVDGALHPLGDRRFLLSPQDLAAIAEVPALLRLGVRTLKIEGRLKAPEYVAAVTAAYRRALDAALEGAAAPVPEADRYALEMVFSRGLFTGWLHGDDHQQLVHARFGKKRGPLVGRIARAGRDHVELDDDPPPFLRPGDGVVFDTGGDTDREQGGRLYEVRGRRLFFEHGKIDFRRVGAGHRLWKTDDPRLNRELRASFGRDPPPLRRAIDLTVAGAPGQPLRLGAAIGGRRVEVSSRMPLAAARTRPLTAETLRAQLGRLGDTPFALGDLTVGLEGDVMLPLSELNRCRRALVESLRPLVDVGAAPVRRERPCAASAASARAGAGAGAGADALLRARLEPLAAGRYPCGDAAELWVLCRTPAQLDAALACGVRTVYVDYEDIRRYADAVRRVREVPGARIYLATPRVQKAGEMGILRTIEGHGADGLLVRNLGALEHFRESLRPRIADYSLNVANPLSAQFVMAQGVERLTVSYDLDAEQALDLIRAAPPAWFEITLHQHMPMFHMAHCVFAAFLSSGRDHTDCGRPCDRHRVEVRDRSGVAHPLHADVGCRNTVFNARAQSGAHYLAAFREAGVSRYRVELLGEGNEESRGVVRAYQALLEGRIEPSALAGRLRVESRLGVTRGTLRVRR